MPMWIILAFLTFYLHAICGRYCNSFLKPTKHNLHFLLLIKRSQFIHFYGNTVFSFLLNSYHVSASFSKYFPSPCWLWNNSKPNLEENHTGIEQGLAINFCHCELINLHLFPRGVRTGISDYRKGKSGPAQQKPFFPHLDCHQEWNNFPWTTRQLFPFSVNCL